MLVTTLVLAAATLSNEIDPSTFLDRNRSPGTLDSVFHDEIAGGARYSMGTTYKMVFDSSGAHYLPRFGPRAEHNMPLHFAFTESILGTTRVGDRVIIERGSFCEIYDLGLEVVEQSFRIDRRPHDGDLVFRIPVSTELAESESVSGGLSFGRSDLGEVRYGDATTCDAAGNRVHSQSRLAGDSIEIVVPDAYLDRAAFPIVIDPLIQTFAVDTGSDDMRNADVVYVPSLNVFVTVYERVFSASDIDLMQSRFDVNGGLLDTIVLTATNNTEKEPAIAEALGDCMTAWLDIGAASSNQIKARRRTAGSSALGATFDVSNIIHLNEGAPDVGATDEATANRFLIVFPATIVQVTLFVNRVIIVPASTTAAAEPIAALPTGEANATVRVNQFAKDGTAWLIAFENEDNTVLSNPDHDIFGTLIGTDGTTISTLFAINDTPDDVDSDPDVGGDGESLFVTWVAKKGSEDSDIFGRRYHLNAALTPLGNAFSLTALDHTGTDSFEQLDPHVGFDGARFIVTYREGTAGSNLFDLYASTFFTSFPTPFAAVQVALEKRTAITASTTLETEPNIASCGFDQAGKHMVVWTETISSSNHDVQGALFSSLGNGSDAVTVQTGCGATEPTLFTSTHCVIGATFQIVLGNVTSPLLIIGTPTSIPFCPGQAGCTLGVSPISILPIPTFISTTIPGDISLLGFPLALQVIDLLPANATGTLCGPPKYSQKFRVSDTRVTTIR